MHCSCSGLQTENGDCKTRLSQAAGLVPGKPYFKGKRWSNAIP